MPRYLVQVDPARAEQVKSALQGLGAGIITQVFDYITIDIPEELVPRVRAVPGVVEVTPERTVRIAAMPVFQKLQKFMELARNPLTFPLALAFSIQADIDKERWLTSESRNLLGADKAEAEGISGKGVKVAVLDTGGDPICLQMPGIMGMSSVEGQPFFLDENGHGTHCYTTIAGSMLSTPWGTLKGVAPDAEIGIFKVLGYGMGAGTETSVMRGMMDAFEWGEDIVSMSLGSPYTEEPTEKIPECRAVKMLTEQGIICVVANGNEGPDPRTVGVPACSPYALSVGAVDRDGNLADFSSRGPTQEGLVKPDLVAPGVDILSSTCGMIDFMQFFDGPKLASISGTSMATPHISGLVALIKQLYRQNGVEVTAPMLKDMLERYGQPKNAERGWGLLTWDTAKRYLTEILG